MGRNLAGLAPFAGVALVLFVAGLALVVVAGSARSGAGLQHFASSWTIAALFACAAALPLSARSVDLSLAGTAAVCGLVFGFVGGLPGLVAGVVVALVIGAVNGVLAGLAGLHPAITTFATGVGMTGLVIVVVSPQGRRVDGLPSALGIAVLALVVLGAVAIDAVTVLNVRAQLPDIARRALMHVAAALLVGVAGVLQVSTLRFVTPGLASSSLLLTGLAAAVIGGTSAFGGWRSLVGAVLAAGFLTAVSTAAAIFGAPSVISWMIAAALLVVALGGDRLRDHLMSRPRAAGTPVRGPLPG